MRPLPEEIEKFIVTLVPNPHGVNAAMLRRGRDGLRKTLCRRCDGMEYGCGYYPSTIPTDIIFLEAIPRDFTNFTWGSCEDCKNFFWTQSR